MSLKPIDPYDDPRVTHEFATLNGRNYHYVQGLPQGTPKGTIFCIHGFPDFWYGWKNIIPYLLQKGFRVVVPDMIGYGKTDMPRVPPSPISAYSWKSTASDMYALTQHLKLSNVILLGHDWGAFASYRIHLYHPRSFTYQIAFSDPQTDKDLESEDNRRKFIKFLYRNSKDAKPVGKLQVEKDLISGIGEDNKLSALFTEKDLEVYMDAFSRGFHGPLNWYKIREVNHEDEQKLEITRIEVPTLIIRAMKDMAIRPEMIDGQDKLITDLTVRDVEASHWALLEAPEEIFKHIDEWLGNVVLGSKLKL
ncbi:alpha/beta-hydrolase [Morchella conica CCBAS932]|uniref:Alpha/beta-hydrolase n=1 Tax=Morchella conica CCBAS932 TaxID=1392247 RepID=A0A3N4KHV0_9PEZI|nr:alpha/beta-hydrolase [Morchella conica CCBAS932]